MDNQHNKFACRSSDWDTLKNEISILSTLVDKEINKLNNACNDVLSATANRYYFTVTDEEKGLIEDLKGQISAMLSETIHET